jgi:hypothetical protein
METGDSSERRKADAAYDSDLPPKSVGLRIEETIFGTVIPRQRMASGMIGHTEASEGERA